MFTFLQHRPANILAPFTDTASTDFFFDAVNLLRQYAITAGCSAVPPMYCPNDNVTRAQMAIFMVRAAMGGDTFTYSATPHFNDVPADAFGFKWTQNQLLPNGTAVIDEISAPTGNPGSSVNVTIAGSNTHFATGTSVVNAGPGITVNTVVAIDSTTVTAQFVIDPAAASGPRSIVITTGAEQAVLPNGFRIP